MKEHGLVGLSVAIVKKGAIVLAKGYGKSSLATGEEVSPDTAFAVGSITKQLTCAAVLLLAEDKKLSVEDHVARYYPDLTRAKDVTLYDLLTHQSGYRDYYPLDFVDREMETPVAPDALLRSYAGRTLDFEPHARFSYSNTNYVLAGRIAEKVSGETFEQLLTRRILKPAGMDHSFFQPRAGAAGIAVGHTAFLGGEPEAAPREGEGWTYAAAGLYASAGDLARWDLALLDGKIIKPKSFDLMTAPRSLADGSPTGYGCGLGISERDGEKIVVHDGAVNGFLAVGTMLPRTRSAVIVLSNTGAVPIGPLQDTLVSLLIGELHASMAETPKINGAPPAEIARALIHQLQTGSLVRSQLGEDYSRYLQDAKLSAAAARLSGLGEPSKIDVTGTYERGGMEVAGLTITFETTSLTANLYRTPDGKIQQFLLYKE